mgnify:CR=1 FL=1
MTYVAAIELRSGVAQEQALGRDPGPGVDRAGHLEASQTLLWGFRAAEMETGSPASGLPASNLSRPDRLFEGRPGEAFWVA